MIIRGVGRAFPPHYYDQAALLEAFNALWGHQFHNPARLEQIHRNVLVGGRHLALPMEAYRELKSFQQSNDAYIRCAVDLGQEAVTQALKRAHLSPLDVDHLFFASVTGLAVPSVDARLVNRMNLRRDIKRSPLFGLGCVAGAAGLARAADYVRAFPDQVAVLLSVELCSLTLQRKDLSLANIISSGLFGDGAAAVVVAGQDRGGAGPLVCGTRSVFYPDSEHLMGWDISGDGFKVVLSSEVPEFIGHRVKGDVDAFLAEFGLERSAISRYICHPGGPKVLTAMQDALGLTDEALKKTWDTLATHGNLSSASVLMVLEQTLADPPPSGSYGLVMAMGPGFCSELVLIQWP